MKGAILILGITAYVTLRALSHPWIGVVGYGTFAVLCPPWNWRWSLPELDYQKYMAVATLLGFLFTGMRRNPLPQRLLLPLLCLWGFLGLCFLSNLQSISPVKSAMFIDVFFKIILMSSLAVFVLNTGRQIAIFVGCLILAQGWNAFNINQLYFERGYININWFQWNFLDNNTYSISSLPMFFLAIGGSICAPRLWQRGLAGFIAVLQIHQIMLLQSRGTMIGALLACGLMIVFMPKTQRAIRTVLAAVVIGSILAGPPVIEEFSSAFKPQGELDSSADSRYGVWKAGAKITMDYPLLGVGPWAGERLVPHYYENYTDNRDAKALHNLLFEVSTGMGIPATILYLSFFGLPWWQHLKVWWRGGDFPEWFRIVQIGILAGIPGYWASSMFSSGALIEAPYLLMAIGIVSLYIYEYVPEEHANDQDDDEADEREFDSGEESRVYSSIK